MTPRRYPSRRPSGLRKTKHSTNSLAHRTTWLRSDFPRCTARSTSARFRAGYLRCLPALSARLSRCRIPVAFQLAAFAFWSDFIPPGAGCSRTGAFPRLSAVLQPLSGLPRCSDSRFVRHGWHLFRQGIGDRGFSFRRCPLSAGIIARALPCSRVSYQPYSTHATASWMLRFRSPFRTFPRPVSPYGQGISLGFALYASAIRFCTSRAGRAGNEPGH